MARRGGGGSTRAPVAPLSLRGVYGGERLAQIRRQYEAAAEAAIDKARAAGADVVAMGKLQARLAKRQGETDYRVMTRQMRSELGRLKRAGLLPDDVDVRSAQATPGLLRRIENAFGVASGAQKTRKVSKKEAAALKEKYPDIQVTKGRAVLSPEFKLKGKGAKIELARDDDAFVLSRRVYLRRDPSDLEAQVAKVFAGMKADELVAMRVGEWNLSRQFYTRTQARAFLATLLAYRDKAEEDEEEGRYSLRYITIVKVKERGVDQFVDDITTDRLRNQSRQGKERRRVRRAKKRADARSKADAARGHDKGPHRHTPKFPPR